MYICASIATPILKPGAGYVCRQVALVAVTSTDRNDISIVKKKNI